MKKNENGIYIPNDKISRKLCPYTAFPKTELNAQGQIANITIGHATCCQTDCMMFNDKYGYCNIAKHSERYNNIHEAKKEKSQENK